MLEEVLTKVDSEALAAEDIASSAMLVRPFCLLPACFKSSEERRFLFFQHRQEGLDANICK